MCLEPIGATTKSHQRLPNCLPCSRGNHLCVTCAANFISLEKSNQISNTKSNESPPPPCKENIPQMNPLAVNQHHPLSPPLMGAASAWHGDGRHLSDLWNRRMTEREYGCFKFLAARRLCRAELCGARVVTGDGGSGEGTHTNRRDPLDLFLW